MTLLFIDKMIIDVEKLKVSIGKLSELIGKFSKVSGYKTIWKNTLFLYNGIK